MIPFIRTALIFFVTLANALDFDNTHTLGSQYCNPMFGHLMPSNKKCDEQTFYHSQDLGHLMEGSTSLDYTLEKDIGSEKVAMIANYSKNGFVAQLLNAYEKDIDVTDSYLSNTMINLTYQDRLADDFIATASQSIFLPAQASETEINPISYTSALETQYFINDAYEIFTLSNYTHLEKPSDSFLSNPYSFETGINYTNNKHTSLSASYLQAKERDKSIKASKTATLTLKRKISKKIKTSLTIHKNLASHPEENKALVKINYAF